MRKSAILIISLLLLGIIASAQEGEQTTLTPRRLLLSVVRQPEAQLSDNDIRLISRALLMRLQAASTEYIMVEAGETETGDKESDEDSRLAAGAQAANADCWLSVGIGGTWQAMTISVRSFDLLSHATTVDVTLNRQGWTSVRDLAMEDWDDLTRPVAGSYHAVEAVTPVTAQSLATLSVAALPGTVIAGLGEPLLIGADGIDSRQVPLLRQYTLRASLRGHGFVKQTVFLTADRLVAFTQAPDPRWSLDSSLQDRGHPGIDITWYFSPGIGFLRLGAMTCLLGMAFDDAEAFPSQPLSMAALQCGFYLTQEDAAVSLYTGFGGFLRVVHETGAAPVIDALSPGGVIITAGAEVPLSARVRFFVEYTPTQYLTDVPDLFRAALGTGNAPGWIFKSGIALNLLSARIGCRWTP